MRHLTPIALVLLITLSASPALAWRTGSATEIDTCDPILNSERPDDLDLLPPAKPRYRGFIELDSSWDDAGPDEVEDRNQRDARDPREF